MGRVSKNTTSCEKLAYWPLHLFWLLHFHTPFAAPDHDIKFSRIACNILYNKNFFPFKMLSSSNGNDSETSEQIETFISSENWGMDWESITWRLMRSRLVIVSELRENWVCNKIYSKIFCSRIQLYHQKQPPEVLCKKRCS